MANNDEIGLSSTDDDNIISQNITVKFQISETQIVAQVYSNNSTIGEIKRDIAKKFEVNHKYIILSQWGEDLADDCKLYETCSNEFGIIELYLDFAENAPEILPGKKPIFDLQVYYSKFRLADFITVHLAADDECNCDRSKDILVEIQNEAIIKPFLGGYRDPETGIEYLDAFTQTGPSIESIKKDGILSRDSQTTSKKTKSIDTMNDASAQAFGEGTKLIHISAASDFIIIPKKYQSFAELQRQENKLGKVILIQKNFRRYLLVRFMKKSAAEYRRLVEEQNRRETKRMDKYIDRFQKEAVTKIFPKTKEDFDMLVAQVQKWKAAEINRINTMYSGAPRIAELHLLLDKEVQLLNGIEKQKIVIRHALEDAREENLLKKMGEPKKWIGYNNLVVEMDLVRNQRVRYLKSIYDDMKKDFKKSRRLEVLSQCKDALEKEEPIPEIDELLDLIEREKNLILLTKYCNTEILKRRQNVLLLEIIKHSKDKKPTKPETRLCDTCKTIKPLSDFALRTRQTTVDTCNRCFQLKEVSSDNSLYRSILRSVQRQERKAGTLTSYAFILQEDDIRYIIVKIWHSHSILSKDCDASDLRLPRWAINDDWSPWNCVCLTELETRNHNKIKDLREIYDENIIQDIKSKHLLAKTTFKRLQTVEQDFVESGDWWKAGIDENIL